MWVVIGLTTSKELKTKNPTLSAPQLLHTRDKLTIHRLCHQIHLPQPKSYDGLFLIHGSSKFAAVKLFVQINLQKLPITIVPSRALSFPPTLSFPPKSAHRSGSAAPANIIHCRFYNVSFYLYTALSFSMSSSFIWASHHSPANNTQSRGFCKTFVAFTDWWLRRILIHSQHNLIYFDNKMSQVLCVRSHFLLPIISRIEAEVEFVTPVTAGGSVKFLPVV